MQQEAVRREAEAAGSGLTWLHHVVYDLQRGLRPLPAPLVSNRSGLASPAASPQSATRASKTPLRPSSTLFGPLRSIQDPTKRLRPRQQLQWTSAISTLPTLGGWKRSWSTPAVRSSLANTLSSTQVAETDRGRRAGTGEKQPRREGRQNSTTGGAGLAGGSYAGPSRGQDGESAAPQRQGARGGGVVAGSPADRVGGSHGRGVTVAHTPSHIGAS